MKTIVSNHNKIQKYQNQLITQLNGARTELVPHCIISWRPENIVAEVNWSSRLNLWWYSQLVQGANPNRWWNAFGIKKPVSYQPLYINCEINPPIKGINRNIAGAFTEDENNKVFIVHRGNRWGGGRVGITKKLFWDNYSGNSELAHDGDNVAKVTIIAELGNPQLPSDISNFVHWVAKIKSSI